MEFLRKTHEVLRVSEEDPFLQEPRVVSVTVGCLVIGLVSGIPEHGSRWGLRGQSQRKVVVSLLVDPLPGVVSEDESGFEELSCTHSLTGGDPSHPSPFKSRWGLVIQGTIESCGGGETSRDVHPE